MEQQDIRNYGLREEPELWKIIGSSKEINEVIKGIQTVLESDVPVVIQGETGTGKELVAKAIHYRGPRSKQPLCTINCAAIPENLEGVVIVPIKQYSRDNIQIAFGWY